MTLVALIFPLFLVGILLVVMFEEKIAGYIRFFIERER